MFQFGDCYISKQSFDMIPCITNNSYIFHYQSKVSRSKSNAQKKENNTGQEIGSPYGVHHPFHVGIDKQTGEINGLPPAWIELLGSSDIT